MLAPPTVSAEGANNATYLREPGGVDQLQARTRSDQAMSTDYKRWVEHLSKKCVSYNTARTATKYDVIPSSQFDDDMLHCNLCPISQRLPNVCGVACGRVGKRLATRSDTIFDVMEAEYLVEPKKVGSPQMPPQTQQVRMLEPTKAFDVENIRFDNRHPLFTSDLLLRDGDFMVQRRINDGDDDLKVLWGGRIFSFRMNRFQKPLVFEGRPFPSLEDLLSYYHNTGEVLQSGVRLATPISNKPEMVAMSRLRLDNPIRTGPLNEVWKGRLLASSAEDVDKIVAVKIMASNATERERKEFLAEATLLRLMDHRNVVPIEAMVLAGSELPKMMLILKYMNGTGGTLQKLLETEKVKTESDILCALLDVAHGLAYLHSRDIIHRNVNSGHCLAHQKRRRRLRYKLAGFGSSQVTTDHFEMHSTRRGGVWKWFAPEAIRTREFKSTSDIWSFGILILEAFNKGQNPYIDFFAEHEMNMRAAVKYFEDGKRLNPPKETPTVLADLVTECMATSAQERPSMESIVKRLMQYSSERGYGYVI